MSENKKRKGQSKLAFPIGLIVIIFAVIGVIFAVGTGINTVKDLTDNSDKKLEYEKMLVPVVMYDPNLFDDIVAADIEQLTISAVWAVIKDEDIYPGKYNTDDQGNVVIPAADVSAKFAELYGTDIAPTHIGVKGYSGEFTFNEQNQCYLVTSAGAVAIYTPVVRDIKKSSNTIVLDVGYIAAEAWAQDAYGNFIEPEPTKFVKVTLRENDKGYYISAIQSGESSDNADPGVIVETVAQSTAAPESSSTESTNN